MRKPRIYWMMYGEWRELDARKRKKQLGRLHGKLDNHKLE